MTGLAGALRNRELRKLQILRAFHWFAITSLAVTGAIYAFELGGLTAVAVAALAHLVAFAVAASVGAAICERYRRQSVLAAVFAARGAIVVAIAIVAATGTSLWTLAALLALEAVFAGSFGSSAQALTVMLARDARELTASNSVDALGEGLGLVAGPLTSAILVPVLGPAAAFGALALPLGFAAVLALRIKTRKDERPAAAADVAGVPIGSRLSMGVRIIARLPPALLLLGLLFVQTALGGAWSVLYVEVAMDTLGLGEAGTANIRTAFGVGAALGAFVALVLVSRYRVTLVYAAGLVLSGAPLMAIGLFPSVPGAFTLTVVVGVADTLVFVAGITMVQRVMQQAALGPVVGCIQTLMTVSVALGAIVAPGLVDALGVRTALIAVGASTPVLVAATLPLILKTERFVLFREDVLAALRAAPSLSRLGVVDVERLAVAARRRRARAGAPIVVEGERGEELFVILEGIADVHVRGLCLWTCSPGELFGDIALIEDVPRTATVIARTDVVMYAIGRNDVLAVLAGGRSTGPIGRTRLNGQPSGGASLRGA